MLQVIDQKLVYIVDFDTMPELPITGLTSEEYVYELCMSVGRGYKDPAFDTQFNRTGNYARALTDAIETGIITEPGKYAIHLVPGTQDYLIFTINE